MKTINHYATVLITGITRSLQLQWVYFLVPILKNPLYVINIFLSGPT
jgi:hypothetical protein